jgi:flagellar protein FlbD
MIKLTRLSQIPLLLNSDLIEHIDMTPDTVITLTTGQKLMVRETAEEIVDKVIAFRRAVLSQGFALPGTPSPAGVVSSISSSSVRESHG